MPGAPRAAQSLWRRIAAALVLIPIALGALWLGHPCWTILVAAAAGMMAWEWRRLTGRGSVGPIGWTMVGLSIAVPLFLGFAMPSAAFGLLALGGLLISLAAGWREGKASAGWIALGTLYTSLPGMALVWLRGDPTSGLATVLWLLLLVWAVDTAAYAAGKSIGGPKLIPRISPSKTWAGLLGGACAAALIGYLAACWAGTNPWPLTLLSFFLALVEQAGDAFESAIKRRFGVKDSSGLIPGHGGILDRLDGLVAVALVTAGFVLLTGGSPLAGGSP
jgi:phosphatidate cytidylyltransferase